MKLDTTTRVLIVGLGLIGGSYARVLTGKGFAVSAIDKDPAAIAYALSEGIICRGSTLPGPDVAEADLVVLALYPHVLLEWIRQYQHLLRPGALLTDVTGVKTVILAGLDGLLRPDVEFIAAHPMAGREKSGVMNSRADLFDKANYIVVPTEKNTKEAVAACRALGETLGFARISELSPAAHDDMIGFVSQLTHCIAMCLMTCNSDRHLSDYTGDSFRDLTRIARLNDVMWSELFLANKEPLLHRMDDFMQEMNDLRHLLEQGDAAALRQKMQCSTERRAWFDANK